MAAQLKPDQLRTWVEVDKGRIKHNVKTLKALTSRGTEFCAVVKSNAYGHNIIEFSREALKSGADRIGVDSLVEGIRLREAGVKAPIFSLGYTLPSMLPQAIKNNVAVTVSSFEALTAAVEMKPARGKKLKVHIKIDSGMHRQGFFVDDLDDVLDEIEKNDHIEFEGLYTHFADAKNPAFPRNTHEQMNTFDRAVNHARKRGFDPIVHAANTAATIVYPEAHYDMVRVGIGMYGLWPSKETRGYAEDFLELKPPMTWKTILSEVKEVPKGAGFSYGFTERVDKKTTVGIIPVGYWHGYGRQLSSVSHVLVGGKRAKVLGLISMDMVIVDLSKVKDPKVGDEVVLIGEQGNKEVTAEELADLVGTTYYETVTRINPLIRRIYR